MLFVIATAASCQAKETALRSLNQLPPFSPTLNRLVATLSREDASFVQIADLIEKDAVLAGSILALVNSAAYGSRTKVSSVRHAVSLLGIAKLRNAALRMSITRMWNKVRTPPGWSMAKFNQHAIATAILADLLCEVAAVDYPEGAFTAGLLHDLGKLLIAVGLPEGYAQIEQAVASGTPAVEAEFTFLGITHAELSGDALRIWKVPEPIQLAVRNHHEASSGAKRPLPLSQAIGAAERYLHTPHSERFDQFGISAQLPRILKTFQSEFEGIRSFF